MRLARSLRWSCDTFGRLIKVRCLAHPMRIRFALIAALFLAQNALGDTESEWYVMSREDGCVSLDQAYELLPFLRGGRSPPELFRLFRAAFPDATIVPFVDYVAAGRGTHSAPDEEERAAYKPFNSANAFVLSSKKGEAQIFLFAADVCNQLPGSRRKPETSN